MLPWEIIAVKSDFNYFLKIGEFWDLLLLVLIHLRIFLNISHVVAFSIL